MVDIALGSVDKILKIAQAIKKAVDTDRQNNQDYIKIGKLVDRIGAHTKRLKENTKLLEVASMRDTLEDMAESLQSALEVVKKCQGKNIILRYLKASDISKQLHQVHDDISDKMRIGNYGLIIEANIALTNLNSADAHPPQHQQNAGQVQISQSSHSGTDQARRQVENNNRGKTMVATVRRAQSDPLSGIAQFSLSQLEAATNNFSKDNEVKSGYYKGVLCDGQDVAIKKLSVSNGVKESLLQHELNIRAELQHGNMIKLLGYCRHAKVGEMRLYFLVEEYLPNTKSLESIINASRLDWSSCFKIIQGIAKGLHYLHRKHILYMDLKPANILVRSDMNPVIVNFELSVVLDGDDDTITGDALAGTLGYVAPEKLRRANVSMKSDVFSFGVILIKIITGRTISSHDDLPEWSSIEMIRPKNGLFDPALADESQLVKINRCREVGLKCIEWDPKYRPTMADVLEMLNS